MNIEQLDNAYRDSEILIDSLLDIKREIDDIFEEMESDLDKIKKLQVKPTKRVKAKMLYMKKRLESAYKTLSKFQKGLKGDYKKIFIEV